MALKFKINHQNLTNYYKNAQEKDVFESLRSEFHLFLDHYNSSKLTHLESDIEALLSVKLDKLTKIENSEKNSKFKFSPRKSSEKLLNRKK